MKRRRVVFSGRSERQLVSIQKYISKESSEKIARDYTEAIRAECMTLSTFSNRGTERRPSLPGVRIIGFRGSATIAFRVAEDEVLIVAVFYRGRNVSAHLKP